MNEKPEKSNDQEAFDKEPVQCPRCGAPYPPDEWRGECRYCGYPDAYYDL